MAILESLKEIAPKELKKGERRSKLEQNHIALVAALEARIPVIDTELAVRIFTYILSIFHD